MAWAANEVNQNDITIQESDSEFSTGMMDLEQFQEHAKEKYDLPEDAATLIFTRKNTQENGEFDTGSLDEKEVFEADQNLQAFDEIVDEYELTGMDKEAAIILTGDIDGKMTTENVGKLIDEGILEVSEDGQMSLTEDKGQEFFDYLMDGDDSDLIGSKHIIEHLNDLDGNQAIDAEEEAVAETEEEVIETHNAEGAFEEVITEDPSGKFNTKTVAPVSYNTTNTPESRSFNTKEVTVAEFNTKDVTSPEESDETQATTKGISPTDVQGIQALVEGLSA
ncbi:MAG TPA: hypothetical protein DHW71_08135 [Gammaproteobacteria bacterium]|nr:hypothetical protein [Gammaproteobacteria bacterium]MEC8010064.1 hypothetical protein [Pseudomonadota bacterium]HBF09121.1 hypothetical protein [Gammaproteobacteria bacterium]HCK92940.1 hypothetical protein [Gammaproteobacteria bacterium]|tara:strand:- start:1143 stop:1979 length:837 start_codon:yes stop_codon:yes gene_type:complete